MNQAALALTGRAGQYATEILQFMMLHKAVGVAVIVLVGSISSADAVLQDGEIGLSDMSDMSGVFAHEGKDTKNLGKEEYSYNQRTQAVRYGRWKHQKPD